MKKTTAMWKLQAAGALVLLLACVLIFASIYFTSALLTPWEQISHLPETVQQHAQSSRAILESAVARSKSSATDVTQPIDEALGLCNAANHGTTASYLVDDSLARSKIIDLSKHLQLLRELSVSRLKAESGTRTAAEIDHSYQTIFPELIRLGKETRQTLDKFNADKAALLLKLSVGSLAILCLIFSL